MIERWPTKSELKAWARYRERLDAQGRALLRVSLLSGQAGQAILACGRWGLPVADLPFSELNKAAETVRAEWRRITLAAARVDSFELGLKIEGGEIAIVAPASMPADQLAALKAGLSGWFIPIAIGVVVVGGLIARAALIDSETARIEAGYRDVLKKADARLCADPKSAACSAWQEEKKAVEFKQRQGLLESLGAGISEIGGAVKGGLGVGLALAVPLVAFMLLRK